MREWYIKVNWDIFERVKIDKLGLTIFVALLGGSLGAGIGYLFDVTIGTESGTLVGAIGGGAAAANVATGFVSIEKKEKGR